MDLFVSGNPAQDQGTRLQVTACSEMLSAFGRLNLNAARERHWDVLSDLFQEKTSFSNLQKAKK
jgi:hypothetical protein